MSVALSITFIEKTLIICQLCERFNTETQGDEMEDKVSQYADPHEDSEEDHILFGTWSVYYYDIWHAIKIK